MTRDTFAAAVLENAAGVRKYELGFDGRNPEGWCDCIGLVIGAFQIAGVRWTGGHGTNWTARNFVTGLGRFGVLADLELGDVVFKAREPGEKGYALPDSYKGSPDKRDYYHIGVVTSVNPVCITHCTSVEGGIRIDNTKGNWSYKALLNKVENGGGGGTVKKAIVEWDTGKTVNLRAKPSTASQVLVQVPIGNEVDVLEENGEWDKIKYQELTGYMMAKFLSIVADDEPVPPEEIPPEGGDGFVKIPVDAAFAVWEALDGVFGKG